MNVDEMMSDPAAPTANTGATLQGPFLEGNLGTPASSQTQAQAHALAQIKSNDWNTTKFREEYAAAKGRLSDQKFDITDYPDPLMPRQPIQKSTGHSAEVEQSLKELISKIKNQNA